MAESDDEVFVSIFEAISPGDKYLARLSQCVDVPLNIGARELRDANAPRGDERRGARQYLRGTLVPRRPFAGDSRCHDWIAARWEWSSGPQKWPQGTAHRRLLPPT